MRLLPLVAGALLAGALSVSAAPAPPAVPVEKYLLDDTDFLTIIEVKPILASPLVARHYRKQIEELFRSEPVRVWLGNAGFDPLKDVERILLVMSRRSHPGENNSPGGGPFILLQGRFDAAKLRAKMAQLAEDSPQGTKMDMEGNVYRLKAPNLPTPVFSAQLDRNTLVLAGKKELVAEAVEKAAGKKMANLKSAAVREFFRERKTGPALQFVADGSTIWQSVYMSRAQNGVQKVTVQHTTLEDLGILRLRGGVSIADKIKGNVTLQVKDAEKAKETAVLVRMGLKQVGDEFEAKVKQIAQNRGENLDRAKKRDLAPLRKALGDTSVESEGTAVTLTTEIDREAVQTFLRVFFGVGMEP